MNIVTRQYWKAKPRRGVPVPHVPRKITVHHTSAPTAAAYKGAVTIQGIQRYHMDTNGWDDIGYHYLIAPDGTVFEGRPPETIGAHVANKNTGNVGVCCIGDFEKADTMTPDQRAVLVELLTVLAKKYKIAGANILGHRDQGNTDCPGKKLYADLPKLRAEVDRGR